MFKTLKDIIDPYFNVITGWASIVGLALTVFLWFLSRNIKEEVKAYSSFRRFQVDRKSIQEQLESNIALLVQDRVQDRQLRSDIFRLLGQLDSYEGLFDRSDKKDIQALRVLLKKNQWSKEEVNEITNILSHLAGRLCTKEEFFRG